MKYPGCSTELSGSLRQLGSSKLCFPDVFVAFESRLEEVLNVNFSLTATFRSITQDHRNEAWISEVEIASADQPAPGGTGNWPDG